MTLKLKIAKFLALHYHMREEDPCALCLTRAEELLTILNLKAWNPAETPSPAEMVHDFLRDNPDASALSLAVALFPGQMHWEDIEWGRASTVGGENERIAKEHRIDLTTLYDPPPPAALTQALPIRAE